MEPTVCRSRPPRAPRRPAPWGVLAAALLLGLAPLARADSSPDAGWRVLGVSERIELSQRDVPGRLMPAFKAVGEVEADLYEVLAVIYDVERHKEWVHDCADSRMVELRNPKDSIVYHRIKVQWPLADRDVAMRTRITEPEPGRHIRIAFENATHPGAPPQRGVARMRMIEGHYDLRSVADGRTRVEYQVESDPGVNAPRSLIVMTAREMPFRTLRNLRRQLERTRGRYAEFIQGWRNGTSTD